MYSWVVGEPRIRLRGLASETAPYSCATEKFGRYGGTRNARTFCDQRVPKARAKINHTPKEESTLATMKMMAMGGLMWHRAPT